MPGKGKPFVKGDERINREGRPTLSESPRWYDLRWWHKLITDNVENLTAAQKVELGLKGLALLVSKLPNIPSTPQESVQNVIDVKSKLEQAESNVNA